MKPSFSNDERIQAVKNFIVARYQGQVKINDFGAMVPYLKEERIVKLCPLPRTGNSNYVMQYTAEDAEKYFEWLVAVVTGAKEAPEEIVKQANDQLFQFIHVLRDYTHMEKNVQLVAPYDWQALFTSFDERLTDIQRNMDRGNKEIAQVLSTILEWLKKN